MRTICRVEPSNIRYTIRLGLQGEYNVIPPSGLEFYFPEVFGRGDGSTFTILPAIEEEVAEADSLETSPFACATRG